MDDQFTMSARLCDDDGMVSHERQHPQGLTYLELLNNLRPIRQPWTGPPFHCTGSAHLAGEHIRCTSPAHAPKAAPAAALPAYAVVGAPLNGWQVNTAGFSTA